MTRGNHTPRPKVKIGKDGRTWVPKWAREGLGIEGNSAEAYVSVWTRGKTIVLEGDAVVLEVRRSESP